MKDKYLKRVRGENLGVLREIVTPGGQISSKMGFPTANIRRSNLNHKRPPLGTYAAFVRVGGLGGEWLPGFVNVRSDDLAAEAHILDFDQNIYGQEIWMKLKKFLHSPIRYPDMETVQKQLEEDARQARAYFKTLET